jgi:AAA family ATP:ADP antiporter
VLTDPECYSAEKRRKSSKKTTSMSLGESAKYLASSKYIRDLATLVIAYGTPLQSISVNPFYFSQAITSRPPRRAKSKFK